MARANAITMLRAMEILSGFVTRRYQDASVTLGDDRFVFANTDAAWELQISVDQPCWETFPGVSPPIQRTILCLSHRSPKK